MSSLVPGSLFYSTGLNRKHTPTPPTITNEELKERYAREPYNGRPWPPSSPISGVYDIRNSSTKLILLNNRKRKESQLRGRNNPRKEEHRYPEPERHSRCSTPGDRDRHSHCLNSSSPYYEPEIDLGMDWLNKSQRPQNRFAAGSAVNPKRHTSCQVPSDPRAFDIRLHSPNVRPNSRTSLPAHFGKGSMKGHRELTPGEQRYFSSITNVYSVNQMIRLKRRQYIDVLNQELSKGLYTRKEYERYRNYITLGRQRQYLPIQNRAMSAPVRSRSSYENDTDRSLSTISGDERSSNAEQTDKKSEKQQPKSSTKQQPKHQTRSSTPDKRPQSTKSSTPSKISSSGRISPGKSSRAASAKSTKSTSTVKSLKGENNQHNKQESKEKINEDSKVESKSEERVESQKEELKVESESGKSKESQNKEVFQENKEEETDKQLGLKLARENEASDSDTNLPSDKHYSSREGKDRPKSRLGHIPEDTNSEEDILNELKREEEEATKGDKKSSDDSSSTNSINLKETNEITTQESDSKQQETNDKNTNQKTKKSHDSEDEDSSNSDEEKEKDPDKLQY